jgi:hypothetical protein
MHMTISYFIKAFIASGVLYTYYFLVLRNKKFHSYNRFYLLASVLISLLIPFVNFNWYQVEPTESAPLGDFVRIISHSPVIERKTAGITPEWIIFSCLAAVSLSLLILLFSKIIRIYRIRQKGTITKMQDFYFIETHVKQAPFSFLNNLFWRQGMPLTDDIGKKIFKHELTHIRQYHSYDKLFTQIVFCIFWMNPFYWLIQKELDTIHEFIADAASIEDGDAESFALMLLSAHNEGRYLSPSHSLFNSSIKRRLIMISSSKKASFSYIRKIMVLPVALLLLSLFSVQLKGQQAARSNAVSLNDNRVAGSDTVKIVAHIEVYGETGKGDTAFVYFKNGDREIYILNNPSEKKTFMRKYGKFLQHPPTPPEKQAQTKMKDDADPVQPIQYEPLHPIPESIRDITFGSETIWLKRRDGIKEQYDLTNKEERKSFESKYGALKFKKDM